MIYLLLKMPSIYRNGCRTCWMHEILPWKPLYCTFGWHEMLKKIPFLTWHHFEESSCPREKKVLKPWLLWTPEYHSRIPYIQNYKWSLKIPEFYSKTQDAAGGALPQWSASPENCCWQWKWGGPNGANPAHARHHRSCHQRPCAAIQ